MLFRRPESTHFSILFYSLALFLIIILFSRSIYFSTSTPLVLFPLTLRPSSCLPKRTCGPTLPEGRCHLPVHLPWRTFPTEQYQYSTVQCRAPQPRIQRARTNNRAIGPRNPINPFCWDFDTCAMQGTSTVMNALTRNMYCPPYKGNVFLVTCNHPKLI